MTESIMIARYPEFSEILHAPQAAEEYEFVVSIATGIRSILSQYHFKEPGDVIIQTSSDSAFRTVMAEQLSIIPEWQVPGWSRNKATRK